MQKVKKMKKLYSIKIDKTGRYVKYCDEHWYETEGIAIPRYTKDQANSIARQMQKHYVYGVTISNGAETYQYTINGNSQEAVSPVKASAAAGGIKGLKLKL